MINNYIPSLKVIKQRNREEATRLEKMGELRKECKLPNLSYEES